MRRLANLVKITHASERQFFRDLLRLVGLAALAKIFTVLSLPILSRLYAPDTFGILSGYVAMLGFVACIGAFKIEYTVSLPRSIRKARYLLAAALAVSLFILAGVAGATLWLGATFLPHYAENGVLICFVFSSAGVLWFSIFRQWLTRREHYNAIGISQCGQSLAQIGMRLTAPFSAIGQWAPGLVIGDVAGRLVMAYMAWRASARFPLMRYVTQVRLWFKIVWPYKKHCATHTLSSILYELPMALMPLSVIYFYGETQAGYVSIAFQATQSAANVVIVALANVFFGNIIQLYHQHPSLVHGRVIRLLLQLSLLMLPGILIVLLWGPWLFYVVFGTEWEIAGIYCQLLLPALVVPLVVGPTLNLLVLTRKIHRQLLVNSVWVIAMLGLVATNIATDMSITTYLAGCSAIYALIYLWLAFEVLRATRPLIQK